MDYIQKIESLKAKRGALETELADVKAELLGAEAGSDKQKRLDVKELAIRQQLTAIGNEITTCVAKLPNSEGADIVLPLLGWKFPHTAVGVIKASQWECTGHGATAGCRGSAIDTHVSLILTMSLRSTAKNLPFRSPHSRRIRMCSGKMKPSSRGCLDLLHSH